MAAHIAGACARARRAREAGTRGGHERRSLTHTHIQRGCGGVPARAFARRTPLGRTPAGRSLIAVRDVLGRVKSRRRLEEVWELCDAHIAPARHA